MKPETLGWILVHSEDKYGIDDGFDYDTPIDELDDVFEPDVAWHWRHAKPPHVGGPYTLLFAWHGEVFGEGEGDVTHKVELKGYNFAFRLRKYRKHKPVAFAMLSLGNRERHHRSLIRLDAVILAAYQKLK
jgi:hypothetical protein